MKTEKEILKMGDKILTEDMKNLVRLNREEQISYNTGFYTGFVKGYNEAMNQAAEAIKEISHEK